MERQPGDDTGPGGDGNGRLYDFFGITNRKVFLHPAFASKCDSKTCFVIWEASNGALDNDKAFMKGRA